MPHELDPIALDRLAADIETEAFAHLEHLVSCNSFTRNRAGVMKNAEIVEGLFTPFGFRSRWHASRVSEHGDHVVFKRNDAVDAGELLLMTHLDTVYPDEIERAHRFAWRMEDDRVFGPGVLDIKGGTIVIWFTLRLLAELAPDVLDRRPITILANAAEEEGSFDFPGIARSEVSPRARACLVFEHGNRKDGKTVVTTSRRGAARFRVETIGRQAHAGSHHDYGVNAIHQLALVVAQIESMTKPEMGLTYNVGRIEGGLGSNTVAGDAHCLVDMRADEVELYHAGIADVLALAGEGEVASRRDGLRARVEIHERPGFPPWPENPGSLDLCYATARAARALDRDLVGEHRFGASDGCHVWDLVPTLDGLGPMGSHTHSAVHDPETGRFQESLEIRSVRERALLNAVLIHELLTTRSERDG